MFRPDGSLLPPNQCPMADVLRTGVSVREQEVHIERPDGFFSRSGRIPTYPTAGAKRRGGSGTSSVAASAAKPAGSVNRPTRCTNPGT